MVLFAGGLQSTTVQPPNTAIFYYILKENTTGSNLQSFDCGKLYTFGVMVLGKYPNNKNKSDSLGTIQTDKCNRPYMVPIYLSVGL